MSDKLRLTKFGRSDRDHSTTQEAYGETTLFIRVKSQYLNKQNNQSLLASHPLVTHMSRVSEVLSVYDFMWLKTIDRAWANGHP